MIELLTERDKEIEELKRRLAGSSVNFIHIERVMQSM